MERRTQDRERRRGEEVGAMSLNIDDIRKRTEAALDRHPENAFSITALRQLARTDVPALLAEVERLRDDRDDAEPYWKMRAERDRLRAAVDAVRALARPSVHMVTTAAIRDALDEHLGED